MTSQLLTSELSILIQESKRKNPDLRTVGHYFEGDEVPDADFLTRLLKSHLMTLNLCHRRLSPKLLQVCGNFAVDVFPF